MKTEQERLVTGQETTQPDECASIEKTNELSNLSSILSKQADTEAEDRK